MSIRVKREPLGWSNKLVARLRILLHNLKLPLRTILAFETLTKDYKHRGKRIHIGEINPVPWYTYPIIEHLLLCDLSNLSVWEWGSGNSTLFWAHRAESCISVERDSGWFDFVKSRLPPESKARCILAPKKMDYLDAIDAYNAFDVIVIDGNWRYGCALKAIGHLKADSVVILDNSDWCPDTCSFFQARGYTRLDFSGFGPANQFTWTTSLFFQAHGSPLLHPTKPPMSLGAIPKECSSYMFPGEHED